MQIKRSEFTCKRCLYFDIGWCKKDPTPTKKSASSTDWCGSGKWMFWSERFKEWEPRYWGEWTIDDTTKDWEVAGDQVKFTGELPRQSTPQEIYTDEERGVRFKEGN